MSVKKNFGKVCGKNSSNFSVNVIMKNICITTNSDTKILQILILQKPALYCILCSIFFYHYFCFLLEMCLMHLIVVQGSLAGNNI